MEMAKEERRFSNERSSPAAAAATAVGDRRRKSSVMCNTGCNLLTLPPKQNEVHFIRPPRQRQRWDDPQEPPHVNWGDLFFDLFYVGLAYNIATLLKGAPNGIGILYASGCFFPVMMEWIERMWYDSRFWVDDDPAHRVFEVIQLCLLATAVLHVGSVESMSRPDKSVEMFVFSLSVSLMVFCNILRYIEIRIWVEGEPAAKIQAMNDIFRKVVTLPFFVAAAVVSGLRYYRSGENTDGGIRRMLAEEGSSYPTGKDVYEGLAATEEENSTNVPIYLCLTGWIVFNALMLARALVWFWGKKGRNVSHKTVTVPMNVDFAIHRYGEWTMLILGESILSLVISTISQENSKFYMTFYAGILSAIVLQYLHYRSQPHDADYHALRRSVLAGINFTFLMQLYSGALVALGASFKMLLYEYTLDDYDKGDTGHRLMLATKAALSPSGGVVTRFLAGGNDVTTVLGDTEREQIIADFYCGSLTIVLVCLELLIITHRGISVNLNRCCYRGTKHLNLSCVLFALFRAGLIVFVATLSMYVWEPEYVAFIGLGCLLVEVLMRIAGDFQFSDSQVEDTTGHHQGTESEIGIARDDNDDDERWPNVTQAKAAPSDKAHPGCTP